MKILFIAKTEQTAFKLVGPNECHACALELIVSQKMKIVSN